jgi:hypothetical protein
MALPVRNVVSRTWPPGTPWPSSSRSSGGWLDGRRGLGFRRLTFPGAKGARAHRHPAPTHRSVGGCGPMTVRKANEMSRRRRSVRRASRAIWALLAAALLLVVALAASPFSGIAAAFEQGEPEPTPTQLPPIAEIGSGTESLESSCPSHTRSRHGEHQRARKPAFNVRQVGSRPRSPRPGWRPPCQEPLAQRRRHGFDRWRRPRRRPLTPRRPARRMLDRWAACCPPVPHCVARAGHRDVVAVELGGGCS